MSKTEIIEELPKLTLQERHEIRLKLAELDGDGWLDDDDPLTDSEKALLDARLAAYEKTLTPAVRGMRWKAAFGPDSVDEPSPHNPTRRKQNSFTQKTQTNVRHASACRRDCHHSSNDIIRNVAH